MNRCDFAATIPTPPTLKLREEMFAYQFFTTVKALFSLPRLIMIWSLLFPCAPLLYDGTSLNRDWSHYSANLNLHRPTLRASWSANQIVRFVN